MPDPLMTTSKATSKTMPQATSKSMLPPVLFAAGGLALTFGVFAATAPAGAAPMQALPGLATPALQVEAGYRLMIRRSKTDQEGQGVSIAVPHGRRLRPVAAVRGWLDAAQITEGPVFRAVLKGSRVQPEALTDRSVAEIINRLAAAAGYDPAQFSGHSLRSGFLTSAAANRASLWKMQAVSRHKSIDVLSGYVRDAEAFDDHAGDAFL